MKEWALGRGLDGLFDWVLQTTFEASVLIALAALAQALLGRRLAARWGYALWLLVLARLMIPAVPSSSVSIFNLTRAVSAGAIPSRTEGLPPPDIGPGSTPGPGPGDVARPGDVGPAPAFHSGGKASARILPRAAAGGFRVWRRAARWFWAAGVLGGWAVILGRHRALARRVGAERAGVEAGEMRLLRRCKAEMGVDREIGLVTVGWLRTPAVFGYRRPRLLVPEGLPARLTEGERRMIYLHELAHVKRGDILLNWVILAARTLHWFNPLVWAAMRRLRAERELACDERVIRRLEPEERRVYGGALIKVAEAISGDRFCFRLAPVVQSQSEIKRRVIMIANFKPAGRLSPVPALAAIAVLCCFTFTGAAEKRARPPETTAPEGAATAEKPERDRGELRGIDVLRKALNERSEELRKAEDRLDKLRSELRVSDVAGAGDAAEAGRSAGQQAEGTRRYEIERINAEMELRRLKLLLGSLKGQSREQLENVMDIAVPDELLTSLLKARAEGERRLASLGVRLGPENPEVRAAEVEQAKVSEQIHRRIEGILAGMEMRMAAMQSQIESLRQETDETRAREADRARSIRPYLDARREVEELQRSRDAIQLRLLQEQIDEAVPRSGRKPE